MNIERKIRPLTTHEKSLLRKLHKIGGVIRFDSKWVVRLRNGEEIGISQTTWHRFMDLGALSVQSHYAIAGESYKLNEIGEGLIK